MGQNADMLKLMKKEVINILRAAFFINEKEYGFEGNYSERDLQALEQVINDLYPLGHEPLMTTLIPFGFYLGETLVRNITGAAWNLTGAEEGDIFKIAVTVPQGENRAVVYPFQRVRNFWFERDNGLAVLYRTINLMNLQFLKPEKMVQGEWMNFPNGDKVRFIKPDMKN